jgi:hypothetical protein
MSLLFPFAFICHHRWFLLIPLALSCNQLYRGISTSMHIHDYGVGRYQDYRLLVQSPSQQTGLPDADNISLVLTRRGCDIQMEAASTSHFPTAVDMAAGWDQTILISFPSPQETDGFRLSLSPNATLPARFLLQGRMDPSRDWSDISTPRFRHAREGLRLLGGNLSPPPPPLPGRSPAPLAFDLRAPWPLAAHEAAAPVVEGLAYACLAACAAAGRAQLVARAFEGLLLAVGLAHAVAGGGYVALGRAGEALHPLALAAAYAAALGLVRRSQRWLRHALAAHGAAALLLRAAGDCLACGDCGRGAAAADPVAIAWLLGGGAMAALARRVVAAAAAAVAADGAERDALWGPLAADPAMAALAAVTARLEAECLHAKRPAARHLDRRQAHGGEPAAGQGPGDGGGGGAAGGWAAAWRAATGAQAPLARARIVEPHRRGLPGTCDEARPVRCLDRLYSQALLVAPRLHARAAGWAAAAGAALRPPPRGPGGGGGAWGPEDWLRGGLVKRPERAAGKALARYGGDASRVLDLCRVRLVVAGAAGAAAAAAAVAADGGVRVVRVRGGGAEPGGGRPDDGFRVR